ncbi:hypothetical protein [Gordonia sp. CPCC 205333]|uniref:hypothetical protein n=1 Tax=Gordonia sp. CPCC 205333 TaxID=3140790 RepID=UPI003AF3D5C4
MTSLGRAVLHQEAGCRTVIMGVTRDGKCEVEEFLAGLPPKAQDKFLALFERYCKIGYLRSPDVMRLIQAPGAPPVHEIKVHWGPGYRLFGVVDGDAFVATHGARKPKKLPSHVKRARDRYAESCEKWEKR